MGTWQRCAWLGAFFIASVGGAFACSSSDNDGADASKDGGEGGGEAGSGKDGGGGGGGGGGEDGGEETSQKHGYVTLSNNEGPQGRLATAGFRDWTDVPGGYEGSVRCSTTTEGACSVQTCDLSTPDAGPNDAGTGKVKEVSAGLIEIRGAKISPALKLEPGPNDTYGPVYGRSSMWSGGDQVTIKAAGHAGGVPAFERTLSGPSRVKLTSPNLAGLTVDRSKDLDVTWTVDGTASGKVRASFGMISGDVSTSVNCEFAPGDKKGKVPSAVLRKLPAGRGTAFFATKEQTIIKSSGWQVLTVLTTTAVLPDGSEASDLATFR